MLREILSLHAASGIVAPGGSIPPIDQSRTDCVGTLFETVIESTDRPLCLLDADGAVVLANRHFSDITGQPLQALIGRSFLSFIAQPSSDEAAGQLQRTLSYGEQMSGLELTLRRDDGLTRTIQFASSPLTCNHRVVGAVGVLDDVSERKRHQALLASENLVLDLLLRDTPLGDILTRMAKLIESHLVDAMVMVLLHEELGQGVRDLIAPSLPEAYVRSYHNAPLSALADSFAVAMHQGESVIIPDIAADPLWSNGHAELALSYGLRACWIVPILGHNRRVLGVFVIFYRTARTAEHGDAEWLQRVVGPSRIAIERTRVEAEALHMAQYDPLTGLANGAACRERLNTALERSRQSKRMVAILMLGLDRFKLVNDTLGYEVGDKLLQAVADRLRTALRTRDTVARLGGDEFVVVLEGVSRVNEVSAVVKKIRDTLCTPIILNGHEIYPVASIGVALSPLDGDAVDDLLRNADAALDKAKREGGDHHCFYSIDMNAMTSQRLALENELRHALERNEFLLHYQPKVDLTSGQIIGMEALIRWQHPQRGLVAPLEFISILEETGLILPVGEWVMRTACRQCQQWQREHASPLRVAVNISARQFQQAHLVQSIRGILDETGLPAHCLEIEITESMVMHNPERAVHMLQEICALGIHVSMDDFGTGYSSLGHLRRFPLGSVKIDRSFIRDIPANGDDASITMAIIALAHNLRLQVVAEGVEEQAQVVFLRAHHCDSMQGYFFSRPLSAEAFQNLLKEGRCLPVAREEEWAPAL